MVFLGVFAALARLHPWVVLAFGVRAFLALRSDLRRFGEHLSGVARRARGRWESSAAVAVCCAVQPSCWLQLLPPPRADSPYPDALDALKAGLHHAAGFHLLPWPLGNLHLLCVLFIPPVWGILCSAARCAPPRVEQRARDWAYRRLFGGRRRRPAPARHLQAQLFSPPAVPPIAAAASPALARTTARLEQAARAVFTAEARHTKALEDLRCAEASAAAAASALCLRQSELPRGTGPAGGGSVTQAEAEERAHAAGAEAAQAKTRALRAEAAVRDAESSLEQARAAHEAAEAAVGAALDAQMHRERIESGAQASSLRRKLDAAVLACDEPLAKLKAAREAYGAAFARAEVARRQLKASKELATQRKGPAQVGPSCGGEAAQHGCDGGAAAEAQGPYEDTWSATAEGAALLFAVTEALEAQASAGDALDDASRRFADSVDAVATAQAELDAVRSTAAGCDDCGSAGAGAGGGSPEAALRGAERAKARALADLERARERARKPLAAVARREAQCAAVQALAEERLRRLAEAQVVLPTGVAVPAHRPLLPEERGFLFAEQCARLLLSGDFAALGARGPARASCCHLAPRVLRPSGPSHFAGCFENLAVRLCTTPRSESA